MDRRQALRRLAAGGTIAAGASMVLASNDVAYAQSACVPTPPDNPFDIVEQSRDARDRGGFWRIANSYMISGSGLTVTYSWQIRSYGPLGAPRLLLISNVNGSEVLRGPQPNQCRTGCPTPFTTPNTNDGAVVVSKTNLAQTAPHRLTSNNRWEVGVLITWSAAGCDPIEATYWIGGRQPSFPTVTKVS